MNIKVQGGQKLSGTITPSGSKNSAVAIIPATILFDKPLTLKNIPNITDVSKLVSILESFGSKIVWDKENNSLNIDNSEIQYGDVTKEKIGNMRGTSLLWGPMLARFGKLFFEELPGGCTLGVRPLGPHYDAFQSFGVDIKLTQQTVSMDAKKAKASTVWLTEMSPTVTENAIMLSVFLKGKTTIIGAASEPQVQDLCKFLVSSGAKIEGVGSSTLVIEGVSELIPPAEYKILSDHYEIATFLALGATTGGEVKVNNALPELFGHIDHIFSQFNINIKYENNTAIVEAGQKIIINNDSNSSVLDVKAQPWPGLPVDMLPLFIPIALSAEKGSVLFHNWMYESGLFWTSELSKLGANVIMADPHRVVINAGNKLAGAKLEAPYIIRAVVAMTMCAMIAEGETTILNADALYRGHPDFAKNLKNLGAMIEEIN